MNNVHMFLVLWGWSLRTVGIYRLAEIRVRMRTATAWGPKLCTRSISDDATFNVTQLYSVLELLRGTRGFPSLISGIPGTALAECMPD